MMAVAPPAMRPSAEQRFLRYLFLSLIACPIPSKPPSRGAPCPTPAEATSIRILISPRINYLAQADQRMLERREAPSCYRVIYEPIPSRSRCGIACFAGGGILMGPETGLLLASGPFRRRR